MIAIESLIRTLIMFGLVWCLRDNIRNHQTEEGLTRGELIFCNSMIAVCMAMNLDWLTDHLWK